MKSRLTLEDRIAGCLVGSAIGAEVGFARSVEPERFAFKNYRQMLKIRLDRVRTYRPRPHRTSLQSTLPLVDLGVRAYVKAGGRVSPEVFGALLRDDKGVAFPAFWWDALHSVQEILQEGMHPRISGMGVHPSGLISAAMPAVGVYHFAHPEYAYLDGVELASVAQPRRGADWAGLCAAAVAAALAPEANGESVAAAVMDVAFRNCRDVFYELDWAMRRAWQPSEDAFLRYWSEHGGAPDATKETAWIAYNPVLFVLPLIKRYGADPKKLMSLLVVPSMSLHANTVTAVIGGAISGALNGRDAFPAGWRRWSEPIARRWSGLAPVVRRRVNAERTIVEITERMAAPDGEGNSPLKEKVRGCILAGAIGNAMGSPVEGSMYWDIDAKHPGGITTVLDPKRLETEDDNQMAMQLVETYLAREGQPVLARHFGKTWKDSLNRDHFFPYCMGHAYDLITTGWDPRIVGHWSQVTGSTVMCMEPVGIYHAGDPEFAALDATAISYMYQRGLDNMAATMLAATVAEAFRPEATVDSVCRAALVAAPRTKLHTFDRRPFRCCYDYIAKCLEIADKYTDVLKARRELYQKCLLYHMIDPLELWGFSLAMFKIADGDVRQAAIGGTNIGRDSDTIAGRAAMLAGTLRGTGGVPKEWVAMFSASALQRIERNSDRLVDLIVNKKLPLLKQRQEMGRRA